MAEIVNFSEIGDIQGFVFFIFRTKIYKLEYNKESEIENGENLQFWQITIEGNNNLKILLTPSFLPWSVAGKMEIKVVNNESGSGHVVGRVMEQVTMVISALVDLLQRWILAEQHVPYWLVEVFNILEDLGDDFEENSASENWFSEE